MVLGGQDQPSGATSPTRAMATMATRSRIRSTTTLARQDDTGSRSTLASSNGRMTSPP